MPDVFPRRNLSPESEEWGREVERRVVVVEGVAASMKSNVSGQGRTTASTLSEQARQVQRLYDLYRSIPKPSQVTGTSTGFGLSGGWQTIASASVTVPEGASQASVFATGSGFLTNTSNSIVAGRMRLVVGGNASPAQPWATFSDVGGWHAWITPGYSWGLAVASGATLTAALQVNPDNAATWGANTPNYATVSMNISFTG